MTAGNDLRLLIDAGRRCSQSTGAESTCASTFSGPRPLFGVGSVDERRRSTMADQFIGTVLHQWRHVGAALVGVAEGELRVGDTSTSRATPPTSPRRSTRCRWTPPRSSLRRRVTRWRSLSPIGFGSRTRCSESRSPDRGRAAGCSAASSVAGPPSSEVKSSAPSGSQNQEVLAQSLAVGRRAPAIEAPRSVSPWSCSGGAPPPH